MNGYICFYRGRRTEVYAESQLAARDKAVAYFRAKKPHEVTAMLAEKDGKPVVHSTSSVG